MLSAPPVAFPHARQLTLKIYEGRGLEDQSPVHLSLGGLGGLGGLGASTASSSSGRWRGPRSRTGRSRWLV